MVESQNSTGSQVWWRYIFLFFVKYRFILVTAALTLLFALLPLRPRAQIIELNPKLTEYIQEALKANPNLVALNSQVEAAVKRIPQAGSWPDPILGFSVANLPVDNFTFDQEPMTATWIQLGQRIPLGGKTSVLVKISKSHTDALRYEVKARQLSLAAGIIFAVSMKALLNNKTSAGYWLLTVIRALAIASVNAFKSTAWKRPLI